MNVWVGSERKDAMALPINEDGVASLTLTENDAQVATQHVWKGCGLFGVINPVVKFSDEIKINTSYVSCQPHSPDFSWLAVKSFSTKEILQSGIVTTNACGKPRASPEPGEIILFLRPLSLWGKMKE